MAIPIRLKARYRIKEVIGYGWIGTVYKAYDPMIKREVALKTVRELPDPSALRLFQKEWGVLASVSHRNVVEIFDIGELEEDGKSKPFYVMPLLRGLPLDKLVSAPNLRVSVERLVEIICETCHGLQAAHQRGISHGDLKPGNIFLTEDGTVKITDFGAVHLAPSRAGPYHEGTLPYMAPERLEKNLPSALSDIFSLGALAYEALTQRRPLERSGQRETIEAILHAAPAPIYEINPAVSQSLTQVVHKAMAKEPWHRFPSAPDFADTLLKALRNEPIEIFSPARLQPRLQRADKAVQQADYKTAAEIVAQLEAEGHVGPAISQLRNQIELGKREDLIRQLLARASECLERSEYALALDQVHEALRLDPENAAALSLKSTIESKLTESKIEGWLRLAERHKEEQAYAHARQALEEVLRIRPEESRALRLLAEVDQGERERAELKHEKERLYQAAQAAWDQKQPDVALTRMDQVLELERRSAETDPERTAIYQNFYDQLVSEHDALDQAYEEARRHLAKDSFTEAMALCDQYLAKYPAYAPFEALKAELGSRRRQARAGLIAEVDRRVEAEPDLEKRVAILQQAHDDHPEEAHFEQCLQSAIERRDSVNSIVAKARLSEEGGRFEEALKDWKRVRALHDKYPGVDSETERVSQKRKEQVRSEARSRWLRQIKLKMESRDYAQAIEALRDAQAEFPDDPELAELERSARRELERAAQVQELLAEGQRLCAEHRFEEGLQRLQKAFQLNNHDPHIQAALSNGMVEQAHSVLEADWRSAESLIERALEIDPHHALARSLRNLVWERKRQEFVDRCVAQARRLQASGDLEAAQAEVEEALTLYPLDSSLTEMQVALSTQVLESQFQRERQRDLKELQDLERESAGAVDLIRLKAISERAQEITRQNPDDLEFQALAAGIRQRFESMVAKAADLLPRGTSEKPVDAGQIGWKSQETVAGWELQEARGAGLASEKLEKPSEATQAAGPLTVSAPAGQVAEGTGRTSVGHKLDAERLFEPALKLWNGVYEAFRLRPWALGLLIILLVLGGIVLHMTSRRSRVVATGTGTPSGQSATSPPATGSSPGGAQESVSMPASNPNPAPSREAGVGSAAAGTPVLPPRGRRAQHESSKQKPARAETARRHEETAGSGPREVVSPPPPAPAAPAPAPVALEGEVDIVTNPPGLGVFIDGVSHGPSPVKAILSVGKHRFQINPPPGRAPGDFTRDVGPEVHRMVVDFTGKAGGPAGDSSVGTGIVQVRTIPVGASVLVDGRVVRAKTPTDLSMASGHHTIIVSFPGCHPERREVDVAAGERHALNVTLACQ